MTRSALVNETTNIVENIIVADPVTPSPYAGLFMVGLKDPVYEEQTNTYTSTHAAGTVITVNEDGSITLTLPDGTEEYFPQGTTIITNPDGTITTSYTVTEWVMVSPGTPCNIGWIYDPISKTFSPVN